MNRMLIAGAGIVAFLSGASAAWAFTTQPVSPEAMSNRLADPDELADKMSNGQSGGTTFGLPGNLRLQFSAPPSSGTANSPFVTSPSGNTARKAIIPLGASALLQSLAKNAS